MNNLRYWDRDFVRDNVIVYFYESPDVSFAFSGQYVLDLIDSEIIANG